MLNKIELLVYASVFRGFHMEEDSILSKLFSFNIFNLILEEKKLFKPWTIWNHLFLIERMLLTITQFHFVKSTTIKIERFIDAISMEFISMISRDKCRRKVRTKSLI